MYKYIVIENNFKLKDLENKLNEFGQKNYKIDFANSDKIILSKEVKEKLNKKSKENLKTKEWLEFFEIYKTIKNSGLYSEKLLKKYNDEIVEKGLHKKVIENLKQYKLYLEVKKKGDFALMGSTYINQKRYLDKWEIIQDISRKWINDIYKDKNLSSDEISLINTNISEWETKNNNEIRSGVILIMIEKLLGK